MNDGITSPKTPNDTPSGYDVWRKELEQLIEHSKFNAVMNVNKELLSFLIGSS